MIILDGTLSSIEPGYESNAGLLAKLLAEVAPAVNVYYRPGLQLHRWRSMRNVLFGGGLDLQIRDNYGALATRYRPEDRISLFGYSRGAFAVRSLSGLIDRVGLLQAEHASPRNIEQAWRAYKNPQTPETQAKFRAAYCHRQVSIEMIGVWDTARALGVRVPFFLALDAGLLRGSQSSSLQVGYNRFSCFGQRRITARMPAGKMACGPRPSGPS